MMADHSILYESLERSAQISRTPCGSGDLVWRRFGSGRPIILVHGGSGSWTHWLKTIPALASRAEVWAVDLPGLGDSAMPPPPLTPTTCGTILADGIRRLIPASARPQLVAFSFGSHVSTYAAQELGDTLAAFIITGCSALGLPQAPMEEFPRERSTMTEAARRGVHRRTLEILMFSDPTRIDDLAIDLQAENIRKARFRSRQFAATDEIAQGLAHVRVPLRSIWGEHDIIGYPSLDCVREALGRHHPELDFRVVSDAGHWVMYEQADAYNAALIDVLGL